VTEAAFYCVSSGIYFLGAVGMINSLRLVGHTEPIFLLDCGLTEAQRELLEPHVTVVPAPRDAPPYLLKTVAPLKHPAEVTVLIDVDMIVTRPLSELIERAAGGNVVAFRNDIDRFVLEWGELLGLGTARRRPYLSSGLVLLGGSPGVEVLRLMDECLTRADFDLSLDFSSKDAPDHPFLFLDQDVLNAILCTRVEPDRVVVLDPKLAPIQPFRGLRVLDEATLRCAYRDGVEPHVLHHFIRKPWLERVYHGIYSRLLARLLLGDDVPVRVPASDVPLRMRNGPLARLERKRVDVQDLVRWYARDVIPEWMGARADALRRRRLPDRR
jgi:hypothetical protein